jgi:thioredoxin reductase
MRDDVVVVGGGAAGLSAALVLARARRTVAVVDAGGPRNAPAAHMHGFLSRDGMSPRDLVAAGRVEVAGYGGSLIDTVVDRPAPRITAQALPVHCHRRLHPPARAAHL